MKGLDTNLLVRYLVKDDPEQAEKAIAYIQKVVASGENCFTNHLVLCELVWVLESAYGYKKKDIADVLQKLLMTKQFEIEFKDTARRAINEYSQGKGDLADYLIGNINHLNGCDVTATFDHDLKNCQSFILLE